MPALHRRAELFFCVKNDVHMLQVFKKICDSGHRPNWVEQVGFISITKKEEKLYISINSLLNAEEQNGVKKHIKNIS